MQKDHSEKPKLRIRNTTLEPIRRNIVENSITNVRAASSHHRSTMMPCDFVIPQNFAKKKLALDRMSIFSTQSLLDVTKMTVPECDDTEMKLLYDQYLQNMMLEVILKKKAKEKAELFLCQLATITKEYEHNEDKLFKLKTRERDIINLIKIQNDVDSQIIDVNNCTKEEDLQTLKDIISKLYNLLQPLDLLRCNDIILPETPEEWKETSKTLKLCSESLKSIIDLLMQWKDTTTMIVRHELLALFHSSKSRKGKLERFERIRNMRKKGFGRKRCYRCYCRCSDNRSCHRITFRSSTKRQTSPEVFLESAVTKISSIGHDYHVVVAVDNC